MLKEKKGYLFAIAAFALWGFFPVFFKMLEHVNPFVILANRILWASLALVFLISLLRQWKKSTLLLQQRKHWLPLLLSTLFIAANWGVYIWAIDTQRIFEASLGYYINPLVNIVFAFLLFHERLRKAQWCAVALAFIGVTLQVSQLNEIPWIAFALALSFGCYGLLHKYMNVESIPSLFVETLLLFPIALLFLVDISLKGQGVYIWTSLDWALLILAGPVTVIPLLCFTAATKRIPYSMVGFLQYITPSILFLLAAFIYKEPFSLVKLMTFVFIWSALVLLSVDAMRHKKHDHLPNKE